MRPARRRMLLACAALGGLGLGASACQSTSPYAAIVNGTPISQSSLLRELQALRDNPLFVSSYDRSAAQASAQGQLARTPVLASGTAEPSYTQGFASVVLSTDVQAQVIHGEVVRRRVEPAAPAVDAAKTNAALQFGDPALFTKFSPWFQREYQLRTAEQDALRKSLPAIASDDDAVGAFYRDNPADFITTQCVSHILVATRQAAAALRAQLIGGADFAALATHNSTDAGSAVKGGALGCNPPGQFVPAFEQAADAITIGAVSEPVATPFGWHLIKVTSRQVAPLTATTKKAIQQHLQQEDPVTKFLADASKSLVVHVSPAYGVWDASQFTVVPPVPPPARSGLPVPRGAATGPGPGQPAGPDRSVNPGSQPSPGSEPAAGTQPTPTRGTQPAPAPDQTGSPSGPAPAAAPSAPPPAATPGTGPAPTAPPAPPAQPATPPTSAP